ncbi:MAG: sigma-70 family RNA polymerase sigma factor [Rubrivivax sp.]
MSPAPVTTPPHDRTSGDALAAALARVALGDRIAFEAVYRASTAHLFGIILRIQKDRALAEDLLQDVYVNIWRHAQGYDAARSPPMAWLTGIARNRAIDSLRRRRTEPDTVSAVVTHADGDEFDRLSTVASDAPGPLEMLEQAGQAHALQSCLGRLTFEQRQCLALVYYQGLSHVELALHLQQPLGTVKSWVRRGLVALKDCLGPAAGLEGT